MEFQIEKLIIWPNSPAFAPQIVNFELGKVNVITGASRTGKSAIIPIIDYCLASSDCHIPIDTIRDYASWYGVVIRTVSEQLLIARRVPDGNKTSNDFYVNRGELSSVPAVVQTENSTASDVRNLLNSISAVPPMRLHGTDENVPYQSRLGFRDLMAFVFQNQVIVANQNIMFYKTHAHEHRERLRLWFPFIVGAETIEILIARQRLEFIEKRLARLKRETEQAKSVSTAWVANMAGHLRVAEEYGILRHAISDDTEPDQLIEAARELVADIPDYSKTDRSDIDKSNEEVVRFSAEDENLSSEIATTKKRLSDLKRLEAGLTEYGGVVRRRSDRLQVSQWLESVTQDAQECPACGADHHPRASGELAKISAAFRQYESEARAVSEIPESFRREEGLLKIELDKLLERKSGLQRRYDQILENDHVARAEFQRQKNLFLFLGHLKASLETFEQLADGGEFMEEISRLESERAELLRVVDREQIDLRTKSATNRISQKMLKYLQNLDVEVKYKEIAPRFSIQDLSVSVQSSDGNWHFLAEVGSASNWVSFHIALMCSLQEFFFRTSAFLCPKLCYF